MIWEGNRRLLEHEQRVLVQPHFDHLSCTYARLISMGAATTFEVHSLRRRWARFEAQVSLVHASLKPIFNDDRYFATHPCVLARPSRPASFPTSDPASP